jgi:predicted small integral membrane protein
MMWGDWTHPLALVLLGAVLVVVGLISWDRVRAARGRRDRP